MGVSKVFWKTLNQGWPEGMEIPTDSEAINGVKRLWRHLTGKPIGLRVYVERGNRRTWKHWTPRRRRHMVVAPDYAYPKQGWPAICHDLSHLIHREMNRGAKPHDSRQARIEKELQRYVVENLLRK